MSLFERWVDVGVIGGDVEGLVNNLELVSESVNHCTECGVLKLTSEDGTDGIRCSSQRDTLENLKYLRIPIENGQLNSRHVRVCESVGLSTIYFRVERVVTHGHSSED